MPVGNLRTRGPRVGLGFKLGRGSRSVIKGYWGTSRKWVVRVWVGGFVGCG